MFERALEAGVQRTVLDLSGLGPIDRAGVNTILIACLRNADKRNDFLLTPGPETVQRVIDRVNATLCYVAADPWWGSSGWLAEVGDSSTGPTGLQAGRARRRPPSDQARTARWRGRRTRDCRRRSATDVSDRPHPAAVIRASARFALSGRRVPDSTARSRDRP